VPTSSANAPESVVGALTATSVKVPSAPTSWAWTMAPRSGELTQTVPVIRPAASRAPSPQDSPASATAASAASANLPPVMLLISCCSPSMDRRSVSRGRARIHGVRRRRAAVVAVPTLVASCVVMAREFSASAAGSCVAARKKEQKPIRR
jgi:hypothetical protein